jgi:hypothetical protein
MRTMMRVRSLVTSPIGCGSRQVVNDRPRRAVKSYGFANRAAASSNGDKDDRIQDCG